MYFDSISDDGARALAAALQHVRGLEKLNVECNSIGDDGEEALRAAAAAACPGLDLRL